MPINIQLKNLVIFILFLSCIPIAVADLSDGLIAYWTMDDEDIKGGNITDIVNYEHNATPNNITCGINGKVGECCEWGGGVGRLTLGLTPGQPDSPQNNQISGNFSEFTVNMWVNASNLAQNRFIYQFRDQDGNANIRTYFFNNDIYSDFISSAGGYSYNKIALNAGFNIDKWIMITQVFNITTCKTYFNSTLYDTGILGAGVLEWRYIAPPAQGFGWQTHNNDRFFHGQLDEITVHNRALSQEEINELYQGYNGTNISVIPPEETSEINIYFQNETNRFNQTYEYLPFKALINLSRVSDFSPINNSFCNLTLNYYESFTLSDFNLNQSYKAETSFINVSEKNIISFEGCHVNNSDNSFIIYYFCNESVAYPSNIKYVYPSNLPLCGNGWGRINYNFTECNNSLKGNISFVPGDSLINIRNAEVRRFYPQLVFNTSFNSSLNLYYSEEEFYFNFPKNYSFYAECTGDAGLDNNISKNVTILNKPPRTFIEQVYKNYSYVNLSNGIFLEYSSTLWYFMVAVLDTNIDYYSLEFRNATNQIFYNKSNNETDKNLNNTFLDPIFFVDNAGNPYNISIFVNDTEGQYSYSSLLFNVTDTIFPFCNPVNNHSLVLDRALNWTYFNVSGACFDEFLFSFNITGSNGYYYFQDEINNNSYTYKNQINISGNTTLLYEVCDGHTAQDLPKGFKTEKKDKSLIFTNNKKIVEFDYTGNYDLSLDFEEKKDRIIFKIRNNDNNLKGKLKNYHFRYKTNNGVYYPNSNYPAHIIDFATRTWFDLSNNDGAEVLVYPLEGGNFDILVKSESDYIEFYSIGALNCINFDQYFTTTLSPLEPETPDLTEEFNSVPQALFYIFLALLWIVLVLMTILLKGRHGHTIQLFNILQMLVGFVFGSAFIQFSFLIGFPVILVALGLFVGLILYDKNILR